MELITKEDCTQIIAMMDQLQAHISQLKSKYRPLFHGEHYLSGEEICSILHISKRTLQEYRDSGVIPYIPLLGKMLYKESDILQLLNDNYIPAYSQHSDF